MTDADTLHVFVNDEPKTFFVAANLEDLPKVYENFYGFTLAENYESIDDYRQLPDDEEIRIGIEAEDYDLKNTGIPPTAKIETQTGSDWVIMTAKANEWAASNGRGFLCSTEC